MWLSLGRNSCPIFKILTFRTTSLKKKINVRSCDSPRFRSSCEVIERKRRKNSKKNFPLHQPNLVRLFENKVLAQELYDKRLQGRINGSIIHSPSKIWMHDKETDPETHSKWTVIRRKLFLIQNLNLRNSIINLQV